MPDLGEFARQPLIDPATGTPMAGQSPGVSGSPQGLWQGLLAPGGIDRKIFNDLATGNMIFPQGDSRSLFSLFMPQLLRALPAFRQDQMQSSRDPQDGT